MTTDHAAVEAQVAAVRQRIRQASDNRIRAEHQREQAVGAVNAAAQAMKAEFGVTSLEEARELLTSLDAQVVVEVAAVNTALQAAGL
jgi:hypothetical protein